MTIDSSTSRQRWLCFLFFILFKLGITSLYISSAVTGMLFTQSSIWDYLIVGAIFIVLAHKLSIKKVLDVFIIVSLVIALARFALMQFHYGNPQLQIYLVRLTGALLTVSLPLSWATVFSRITKREAKTWALILGLVSGVLMGGLSILQYVVMLGGSPSLLIITSILFLCGGWLAIRYCEAGDGLKKPQGSSIFWGIIIMLVFVLIDLLEANLGHFGKGIMLNLSNHQAPEYGVIAGEASRLIGIVSMVASIVMLLVSQLLMSKKGMHFTTMFLLLVMGLYSLLSYGALLYWGDHSLTIWAVQKGVFSGLKYYLLILLMMQAYRFMVQGRFQALSFVAIVPFFTGLMKSLPSAVVLFLMPGEDFKRHVLGQGAVFIILFGITLYFAYRLTAKGWHVEK